VAEALVGLYGEPMVDVAVSESVASKVTKPLSANFFFFAAS